jgi:formamidopyrimidine-DNA glycosylase
VPELPEVETVRRQLADSLMGAAFEAVVQVEPAMLRDCSADEVGGGLPGRRVVAVDRLGKFLIAELDDRLYLTLHLGMTGQLLVSTRLPGAPSAEVSPHTRFLFELVDRDGLPITLEFRDMRKFGRVHLTEGGPAPRLEALGPDAWQGSWDAAYLAGRLRGRTTTLKTFLLDQRHLSGIGNIYADEILWWTELSPLRESGKLSSTEVARLTEEIPRRLNEGVELLGCSLSDFVDTAGNPGTFQDWLRAYGRRGEACARCGGVFERVVIGGRGTTYCPGCQH